MKAAGDPQVVRSWSEMVELEKAYELAEKTYRLHAGLGMLTANAQMPVWVATELMTLGACPT